MQVQSSTQVFQASTFGVAGRSAAENLPGTSDVSAQQRVNPRDSAGSQESVEGATQKLQDFVSNLRGDIQFSVDEDSGQTIVKVIDRSTKDVLMQLPSKEALEIAKALDKFQGLLVKQQA